MNRKHLVSPVRWVGAKSQIRSWIISLIPDHHAYVEAFAGSGTVLLNKEPSKVEVYNDLDERLYTIFSVLRDPVLSRQLRRQLNLTPYHEKEFSTAWELPLPEDAVARARVSIIRLRMGFGGIGSRGTKPGFGFAKTGNPAAQYRQLVTQLPLLTRRLANVQIMCRPAISVVDRFDGHNTVIYCDPPYVPSTRKSSRDYVHEMSLDDHEQLAMKLNDAKSKVIVSGYDNQHYRRWFKDWNVRSRKVALRVARDKSQSREEFVWINY